MAYVGTPIDTRNQFQSLQGKRFDGDGSTTDFTLDVAPSSTLDIEVFVGNVRQDPNSAYTLSGTTLSFTGAPPSGTNNIYVVHQAKSVGTIDVPAGGVAADSLATSVLTGQTDIGAAIADSDLFLVDDGAGGTLRKTAASRIKTYAGFSVSSITGATALDEKPALTDELVFSDAGTLKRVDYTYLQDGLVKEYEQSFSSSSTSSIDIETTALFDSTYDWHVIKVHFIDPENDDVNLEVQMKHGGSYKTDSYYRYNMQVYDENADANSPIRSTGAANWRVVDAAGNADSEQLSGEIIYTRATGTTLRPMYSNFFYVNSAGRVASMRGVGYYANSNAVLQGIRLKMSSGGFNNAKIAAYGLKI